MATHTLRAFFSDNVTRLGAALAFYTTIAVAPLLLLAIAVAGTIFDQSEARQRVLHEINQLAGSQVREVVASVQPAAASHQGRLATVISSATLLFGAFGVFYHLQDALNAIWHVAPKPHATLWETLRHRLFSLATVVATGFLLLVSLIASAALSWLGAHTVRLFGGPAFVLQLTNFVLSLALVTALFALIFRLLPDVSIRWRQVWAGALLTAVLFTVGKAVLGLYLSRASVTSGYGAAGSLIVLLLWSYYAAQIVFLGAEFTRVTTLTAGGRDFSRLSPAGSRIQRSTTP